MWPTSRRRRAAVLVLAFACAVLAAEGALRFLLFHDAAAGWTLARGLRRPERFGYDRGDDAYHVLRYRWLPSEARAARPPWAPHHDPRVGWTSERFTPGDYRHVDETRIGDRRLVLLLGDSFAACVDGEDSRFEALLERSPRGAELALLNYGVPGFGLDQIHLLLAPLCDRFAPRRPTVLIGILADDDLDRALLRFRDWPKPRLALEGGRLVVPAEPVPTAERFLAEDPPLPASYAWRLARTALGAGSGERDEARAREVGELARALLAASVAEARARGVDLAFVLFQGAEATADPAGGGWRADLVRAELKALGAPCFEARDDLLAAAARAGRPVGTYFRSWDGHLGWEGNAVVLETLLRAIGGASR